MIPGSNQNDSEHTKVLNDLENSTTTVENDSETYNLDTLAFQTLMGRLQLMQQSVEDVQTGVKRDLTEALKELRSEAKPLYKLAQRIDAGVAVVYFMLVWSGLVGLLLSGLNMVALASERAVYLGSLRSSHRRTMTVLLSLLAVSAVTLYHLSVPAEALLALGLTLSVVLIVGFEVRAKDLFELF